MSLPPLDPPIGDPDRQAPAGTRGFVYQAWHAVLAWITLADDEALFLEAAEDIDLRRPGETVTGQVKDYPGASLTLGSQEARTALKHFWRHRAWNPTDRVSLHYLTRARQGHERTPFPSGRRGLDVWDLALHDDDALAEVRTYLLEADLSDEEIAPDLPTFLQSASDSDLREQLISRVQWDTDAPDHGDLKGLVERHLILHGSRHGVLPSLARAAADTLFTTAIETASAGSDRRLTRTDFLSLFEDRTLDLQPAADQATIAATAARLASTAPLQRTPGDPGFLDAVIGSRLAIPLRRPDAVDDLLVRLSISPLVAVHGSSGMGKSTLAELAAEQSPAPWVRLDLRGLDGDALADRLDEAAIAVASLTLGTVILADDLADPNIRAEGAVRRLFGAIRARQGRLVVTTHTPLPHGLTALVSADPHLSAPPLDDDDLQRLVLDRGCPPGRALQWAQLALIRTSGHPLLADVYAREAAHAGWPPIRPEDLTEPVPPLTEVQRQVRTRLRDALPTEATALVIRLSVFTLPFTRDHALRLAQSPPPIPEAGDGLDRLIGPWIEPYGPIRFRVSPLLKDAYKADLPSDAQRRLHADAADALLVSPLTGVDLSGVLSHGILGESDPALFNGYAAFTKADEATVEALVPYIDWFASVYTEGAYRLIAPANPALSLTLRSLQFQLANASGRPAQALAVLDAWERDLQNATDLHPEALALFTLQLHTHLAVNLDLPIEIGRAAASAQTLLTIDPKDSVVAAIESPLPDGTPSLLDHLSPETLAEFLAFRCQRASHLRDLLAVTQGLDDPLRSAVVEALRERHALTMGIVGRVWSNESLEDVPDWDDVLDAFAVAVALAREHNLPALLASAAVGQAIVHAEYLDAFDDAYDALDAADDILQKPDPRVASYRAKAHGLQGHHEQALELFESVLPRWREVSDNDALGVPGSSLAYDFADAIRAAGRLGRYSDAARWAAMGAEAAEPIAEFVPSLRLGYLADQALARALDDDLCGTVGLLVPVLDDLPPPDTPLLRKLYRRLSTLIAWLEERSGGRPFGFPTPELGQLSRTDEDEYPDVGLLPASNLWAALGEAERHAGCGTVVQSRARAERDGDSEPFALVAGFFSDLTDLVHDAPPNLPLRLARLTQRAQTHLDGDDAELTAESPSLIDIENGTQTLIYIQALALTRVFAEGAVLDLPLTSWRTHAVTVGADVGLVDEWAGVTVLAIAHVLGDSQAAPHLWDVLTSSAALALRWTASLAFAAAPADPVQHLQAIAFLTDAAAQPPFRPTVARAIATLADAEILPSDRDGIQAAARTLLDRPHASKLPLEMAVRIRDLAVGKDRRTDPPLHGRL